jgi:squalene monooxygenase
VDADCLEGIDAIPVHGYQVIYYDEPVDIPYPKHAEALDEEGNRPEGRSFHHGRFVRKLREAAAKTPNVTMVETVATSLVQDEWTNQVLGVECKTAGEKDYVRFTSFCLLYTDITSTLVP